jgi:hypothetical protein
VGDPAEARSPLPPVPRPGIPGLRVSERESRVPVAIAVAVAIGLQVALPDAFQLGPRWVLPGVEAALLVGLVATDPLRSGLEPAVLRAGSRLLTGVVTLANTASAALLVQHILSSAGPRAPTAERLLGSGAAIYLTNIIAFALWYWEFDRGGPAARARALRPHPDFLFPQMTAVALAPEDWRPLFVDYLYVSFTNATAFSPTDTMPLSRWAKMLMLVQSSVALAAVALVVARAVNILSSP